MGLSYFQKEHLYEHGYVHVPGVVSQFQVEQALRAINSSIGTGMNKEDIPTFSKQTYCPEITGTSAITDLLLKSPAWELVESVMGEGNVKPVRGGQIAVRFPTMQDPPRRPGPHIDGTYSPGNGVKEGTLSSFTMLFGVQLSDLHGPNAGNFTVWPGTHRIYESYLREHGTEKLLTGTGSALPNIDMVEPVQTVGKAGDVFLCHYELAHGVAANVSPYPRYAIYFRLFHKDHDTHKVEALTNIWTAWPGMQEILQQKEYERAQ